LRRSHPKKTRGVTGVSISKSTDAIKVDDSYNLTASTTKATISAEVKTAYALLQSLGWPSIISTEPKHTLGIPAAGALAEADAVSLITPY